MWGFSEIGQMNFATEGVHSQPTANSHRTRVRVRFGDTDPYGVVYFAAYFGYFKTALDEYLRARELAPDQVYRDPVRGFGLPIVGSGARFVAPARYDDELEVTATISHLAEKAVVFAFQIHRPADGALIATGHITCVAIDRQWNPVPIPQDLVQQLRQSSTAKSATNGLARRR